MTTKAKPKWQRQDEPVVRHAGIERVRAWSLKIHGPNDARHVWCMLTAAAMVDGKPLPESGQGTPFTRHATAETRRETIRNLVAGRKA